MTFTLFLAFCIFCPVVSYLRFRSLLHPHFLFTISWVYLLPFSVVVSPSLPEYLQDFHGTGLAGLSRYYLLINGFLFLLFLVTMYLRQSRVGIPLSLVRRSLSLSDHKANLLLLAGLAILGVELVKELYACNGSLHSWFEYSIGPRFGRPWGGGYVGGADFFFTFIGNLFYVTPILLPFAVFVTRGAKRIAGVAGLLLALWILTCNGSRTPVALTVLTFALLWHFNVSNPTVRLTGLLALVFIFLAMVSIMITFRQNGFVSASEGDTQLSDIKYEQDDNYYQLMAVLKVAEDGNTPTWDASEFLEASIVNPIPRYFWPGKPLITETFFGDWKLPYVTISYIGECIAMFGKWLGLACALLIGLLYYQVLVWASRLMSRDFGLLAYLGFCFYIYMTQRSIQNIGMDAVVVGAILAFYYWFGRPAAMVAPRKRKRSSTKTIANAGNDNFNESERQPTGANRV